MGARISTKLLLSNLCTYYHYSKYDYFYCGREMPIYALCSLSLSTVTRALLFKMVLGSLDSFNHKPALVIAFKTYWIRFAWCSASRCTNEIRISTHVGYNIKNTNSFFCKCLEKLVLKAWIRTYTYILYNIHSLTSCFSGYSLGTF